VVSVVSSTYDENPVLKARCFIRGGFTSLDELFRIYNLAVEDEEMR
jgi:hypothetical protein